MHSKKYKLHRSVFTHCPWTLFPTLSDRLMKWHLPIQVHWIAPNFPHISLILKLTSSGSWQLSRENISKARRQQVRREVQCTFQDHLQPLACLSTEEQLLLLLWYDDSFPFIKQLLTPSSHVQYTQATNSDKSAITTHVTNHCFVVVIFPAYIYTQ